MEIQGKKFVFMTCTGCTVTLMDKENAYYSGLLA